ncbi:helix-turn-helix domain-containing protein [Verrucomicrobiota bacterium]
MPNIAKVLKDEITRLAKKEAKAATAQVRRDNIMLKKTAADLKRRTAKLEKENRLLIAAENKRRKEMPEVAPEEAKKVRLTSKGIRSLRSRLGLSQAAFAKLLGAASQSVYIWEKKAGALNLRDNMRDAVLSLRGIGAREAQERLKVIEAENKKTVRGRKKK